MPLGTGGPAQKHRHDWVVAPRKRPHVPVIFGALGSKSDEENAKKLLLLFWPWTSNVEDATDEVPYIGDLRPRHMSSWREALSARIARHGFPTEEVRRYATNYAFVYCRPRQYQLEDDLANNSDNDFAEDQLQRLDPEDLKKAIATRIKGSNEAEAGDDEQENRQRDEETSTQRRLTAQMFDLSKDVWRDGAEESRNLRDVAQEQRRRMEGIQGVQNPARFLAAARASGARSARAQPQNFVGLHGPQGRPAVNPQRVVTAKLLRDWLDKTRFVEDRLEDTALKSTEPLVWQLHGSPGTGKSHSLKFVRELFEEVLGFRQGIDFEVAAFQATNAADVRGHTIHKACGISMDRYSLDKPPAPDTTKQMAFWRWLIVDEIGMVSARLLAQMDQRIRSAKPAADEWKIDPKTNRPRPFGGVNVLFTGDFAQLPPPEGGGIAEIPELFWNGAVQGVTELVERERCKDEWWNEVVDELREGYLSDKNHKYLHGRPVEGCTLSSEERASRQRVIDGPDDPRLQDMKFVTGTVIVANNDAKYQINKDRAAGYARAAETPLRWSVAKDKALSKVLQTQACDKDAKLRWLQYHDMDTEGLCGMLPLAIGMPVALTQHVDRSEQALLKGRMAHVYVKFKDADWTLDGSTEKGLYPIEPVKRTWKLDKGRKNPVLAVSRTQLPLVPAFAITAHSSQGKTLSAVLLDFNIHRRTHVSYGTVVASRVRSREDVLILRAFPAWLYQRGPPEGVAKLLQRLRGELNLDAFREATWPSAPCEACRRAKPLNLFADAQWQKARANRPATCLACEKKKRADRSFQPGKRKKHTCAACNMEKIEDAFPPAVPDLRQGQAYPDLQRLPRDPPGEGLLQHHAHHAAALHRLQRLPAENERESKAEQNRMVYLQVV
ncbi:pfh1 [Symbiodinium natans]|uniref:ATP-dependent DNA helicase n=1 Tax=Symbiodinium natans TaxID=878477 RepID=A0A812RZ45_9DINO|nr:pfh1 [Symbiodinium natans]